MSAELYHHPDPPFTRWIVDNGLLLERLAVIDVGCQGGPHPRWKLLGDAVDFHGFDPIAEVIERLDQEHGAANCRFHCIALGDEDGKREFHVRANSFESSFYAAAEPPEVHGDSDISRGTRMVDIRKLDTLAAEGRIPVADYVKLDCEGFEGEVLAGAQRYFAAAPPLCVATETNFSASPTHRRTHYVTVSDLLVPHGLRAFDLVYFRYPAPSYAAALATANMSLRGLRSAQVVGRPATFDFLFCRDLVAERDEPQGYVDPPPYRTPSVDRLIKSMILFELHGLMDCAFEVGVRFREQLEARIDVSWALKLLLLPAPTSRG